MSTYLSLYCGGILDWAFGVAADLVKLFSQPEIVFFQDIVTMYEEDYVRSI